MKTFKKTLHGKYIKYIFLDWGSYIGKKLQRLVAYVVSRDTCKVIIIHPSVSLSRRWFVQFFPPFIRSSVRQPVCPSVRPSVRQPVCPSVCPSVSQSVRPSVRQPVCPSIRLSIRPSVRPSASQSVSQSVHQSVRQSVCQFVHSFSPPSIGSFVLSCARPTVHS